MQSIDSLKDGTLLEGLIVSAVGLKLESAVIAEIPGCSETVTLSALFVFSFFDDDGLISESLILDCCFSEFNSDKINSVSFDVLLELTVTGLSDIVCTESHCVCETLTDNSSVECGFDKGENMISVFDSEDFSGIDFLLYFRNVDFL